MSKKNHDNDAATKFLNQAQKAETWKEWLNVYYESLKSVVYQFKAQKAPVTAGLVGITSLVFSLQAFLYLLITDTFPEGILIVLTNRGALTGLTAWLFVNFPSYSWFLTEFLHKGIGHFIANIALLALFGKTIEPKFQTRRFILWFLGVAIIVKPIDALITLSTSTKSNVAVYGISDFVYSLAFYSVFDLNNACQRTELEYLALLVGVAAILQVSLHMVTAAFQLSIQPINPAHLLGGMLGMVIYGLVRLQE